MLTLKAGEKTLFYSVLSNKPSCGQQSYPSSSGTEAAQMGGSGEIFMGWQEGGMETEILYS